MVDQSLYSQIWVMTEMTWLAEEQEPNPIVFQSQLLTLPRSVWASSEHNHPRAEWEFCCQKAKITKQRWQHLRHKSADSIRDRD